MRRPRAALKLSSVVERGFLVVGPFGGARPRVQLRIHWSLPLGAAVFSHVSHVSHFELVPAFWAAYVLLIFLHEVGHAVVVLACRRRVLALDVHGFGGTCHWDGAVTPMQRAAIAWGGVWAQALVLAATHAVLAVAGPPTTASGAQLVSAFAHTNLYLIALNLLPLPPLDGAQAWRIVPLVRDRLRVRRARAARSRAQRGPADEILEQDAALMGAAARSGRAPSSAPFGSAASPVRAVRRGGADAAVDALFDKLERERGIKRRVKTESED
jgi:Zn-dependent protease